MKHSKAILPIVVAIMVICGSLPIYAQTDLYKQYEHRTDMVVMCVMDFPITPDLKTDITLFMPKNKEDLWPMVQEFNLGLNKDTVYNRFEKEERYILYSYNVRKDNIKKRFGPITSDKDYKNMARLVYNYNMGTIMIIHDIESKERDYKIEQFLVRTLKQPELLPNPNNRIDNNNR